jgi:lipopolysaccharide export system protein LptA
VSPGIALDKNGITADRFEGTLDGTGEWSGNVTLTTAGVSTTCDRLKIWLTPDQRYVQRAEATGNVVVRGRHFDASKTEWEIVGKAKTGTYEKKSGQGTLQGSVKFAATNLATGAVLSVEADRMVYDVNTRRFRFEGIARPVRGQWEEPASEGQAAPGGAQPRGEQTQSDS